MSESQDGAGRREVAWRLFASEFDDADFSYSQSDEERAPNYVVSPTGARVNRLFVVGVLTEIETVSEDYLRARVVDPTGPFVIYAGQYQPDALAFLERADPPTFVAVTGKARTYQPDDSDQVFTSIRPESMSEVESDTRDRWVVQTAEQTVDRVTRMAEAKQTGLAGDELETTLEAHGVEDGLAAGIPLALDHYGTTGDYLAAVREMALDSARVVAGEIDEAETLNVLPGQGGDDALADLVERPIEVESIQGGDEAAEAEASAASTESEEAVAEAGAGNGSAIGTAESSNQNDAESESGESTETPEQDVESETETETATTDTSGESTGESEPTDEPEASTVDESRSDDVAEESQDTTEMAATNDAESADEIGVQAGAEDAGGRTETVDSAATSASTESTDDDENLEDFDADFDLDDDEREEIEEEYGTEFQSGTEVSEPGEAGIETPDSDEMDVDAEAGVKREEAPEADAEAEKVPEETSDDSEIEQAAEIGTMEDTEPGTGAATEVAEEDAETASAETTDGESSEVEQVDADTEPESVEEVDLEDAVMDAMADLDEGDGAVREDVLAAVVDRTGADPDDVEDAIQDSLMGGRCYEPDDETLKPI